MILAQIFKFEKMEDILYIREISQEKRKKRFVSFYMKIAEQTAELSRAERKKVGAVIVDEHLDNILAFGYNGTPRGFDNKCEDKYNKTKPEVMHAETNAITKIARSTVSSENSVLFLTLSPCFDCAKLIIQSGIKSVYYKETYRDTSGLDLLKKANIYIEQID